MLIHSQLVYETHTLSSSASWSSAMGKFIYFKTAVKKKKKRGSFKCDQYSEARFASLKHKCAHSVICHDLTFYQPRCSSLEGHSTSGCNTVRGRCCCCGLDVWRVWHRHSDYSLSRLSGRRRQGGKTQDNGNQIPIATSSLSHFHT